MAETDTESTQTADEAAATTTTVATTTVATPGNRLPAPLADWIVRQRWFAGTDLAAPLSLVAWFALPSPDPAVRLHTLLVLDPGTPALYQVPLALRDAGTPASTGVVIAEFDGTAVFDAPREPIFASALLELAIGAGSTTEGVDAAATGARLGWNDAPPAVSDARVLSGEQSNTSIILELADAQGAALPPAIVKVFRAIHHGENPDVVLQSAIAAAGSTRVPGTHAAIAGSWPDSARSNGVAVGHLAVVHVFLAGTEDAWRVALRAAEAGEDFTSAARDLGAATAEVHRVLAEALPTTTADRSAEDALVAGMHARAATAAALVPDLAAHAESIAALLQAAEDEDWPPLQRIHGDYHLGQVLLAPHRGWVLLDFEGEPLRPMSERNEPDIALRDVAGMLRSFDYVAGTIEAAGGDVAAARAWTAAARDAFLAGYASGIGHSLEPYARLLAALELDKALYECEYEVRNRPTWLPIPLRAIHRLLES